MLLNGLRIVDFERWVKIDASCFEGYKRALPQNVRKIILERDNYTCVYCGNNSGPFDVDHIFPKSRGGDDCFSNLVCACQTCNRSKNNRTPEEWREAVGSI